MTSSASSAVSTHSSGTLLTVLMTVEGGAGGVFPWATAVLGGAWVSGGVSEAPSPLGRTQPRAAPGRNSRPSAPHHQRGRAGTATGGGAGRDEGSGSSSTSAGS